MSFLDRLLGEVNCLGRVFGLAFAGADFVPIRVGVIAGASPLGKALDLAPELLPGGLFIGGKLGEFVFVTHTGNIGIALPVLHVFMRLDRIFFEQLRAHRQIGLKPIERLLA